MKKKLRACYKALLLLKGEIIVNWMFITFVIISAFVILRFAKGYKLYLSEQIEYSKFLHSYIIPTFLILLFAFAEIWLINKIIFNITTDVPLSGMECLNPEIAPDYPSSSM